MAINVNLCIGLGEDKTITVNLNPAVPIGGWDLRAKIQNDFGGLSGFIQKSCASGYGDGASGIQITNSGQGQFKILFDSIDTSGLQYKNYSFTCERFNSGYHTVIALGYLTVTPSIGGVGG